MGLLGLFKGKRKQEAEPAASEAERPLGRGLAKTRSRMAQSLRALFGGGRIDEALFESIEDELLVADVGVPATRQIVDTLRRNANKASDASQVRQLLHRTLVELLQPTRDDQRRAPPGQPWVMLVVGVNGSGKTTTIGKLADKLRAEGHSVLLAAGDTFRAAAVEQLQQWGERVDVPVMAQQPGADAAAVIHDALAHAASRGYDVVLADTAGRLHTQSNLMDELRKVRRVIARFDETAPHETLLVLDGGSGQNAIAQAKQFSEAVDVTGLALTKLDGTAKGGVAFAVVQATGLPIRFIGVGERTADLRPFDPEAFVDALLEEDDRGE